MESAEDWRTFSAHLDQALELDHEVRRLWLAALAERDPALAERLRSALAAQTRKEFADFLAGPSPMPVSETAQATLIGRAVGPYVIDAEIGRGGMGSVWRAHRADGRFAGNAAIKFVHAAWIGNSGDQRFRTEGTLLASLDHPHIARLIDAGVLEGAQPYLILEYVEGEPIDVYCERSALPIEERLRLFLDVLEAVSHAHSHLIVHRDLKPSNVLVTRDGTVKLLDFGIAKLLDEGTGVGAPTQSRASALTPRYAAPEQLLGRPVTTATDVYALGLLLYELLTGSHPFSADIRSHAELLSMVLTKEPPRASLVSRVKMIPKRMLQGDLDNILHKTLKKDPGERYSSARALGEDLQRHLTHQPVRARADTLGYRTRKFVRRNRLSTALATLAIIALLAALVTAIWQSRSAQAAAAHAEIERGRATATRDFLISVFQASDPRIAQDKPRGQVTARELLDNSAQRIHATFWNHPDTELELLGLTASIYRELGEEDRFRSLRDQQVKLAHRLYGDLHPIVIEKLLEDAHAASDAGDDKAAQSLLAQADALIHRARLDHSALRARWWYERSESLWTEPPPRTALVEAIHKSVDLYAAVAPQDPGYVSALNTLGNEHSSRFDDEEAVKIYRHAMAVATASPNRDEAEMQSLISNLAESLLYSGDFDGAETMNKASIELARRTNGEGHVRYWRSMAEYAYEVHLRGDRDRALDMFRMLIKAFPAVMTPLQSKNAADVEDLYARCLTADGNAREAIPILENLERIFGVSSPFEFDLRVTQGLLGEAYALAGRSADAKRELRASLDGWEAKSERDSYPLLNSREKWGRFLLTQGDLEGADRQFREVLLQSHSRNFMPTVRAQIGEAQIAIAHQNIESALEKSLIALDMLGNMKGVRDMRLWPEAWVARSEALRLSRDLAGARQWALRALEASQKYDAPGAISIANAKHALHSAGGGD